MTEFLVGHEGE